MYEKLVSKGRRITLKWTMREELPECGYWMMMMMIMIMVMMMTICKKWDFWNDSVMKNRTNGHLYPQVIQVQSLVEVSFWLSSPGVIAAPHGHPRPISKILPFVYLYLHSTNIHWACQDTEMSETSYSLCLRNHQCDRNVNKLTSYNIGFIIWMWSTTSKFLYQTQ